MTEPVEKTYYMPVYEKCPECEGWGCLRIPIFLGKPCSRCHGEGYIKVYISFAEWAAQTREHIDLLPPDGQEGHAFRTESTGPGTVRLIEVHPGCYDIIT